MRRTSWFLVLLLMAAGCSVESPESRLEESVGEPAVAVAEPADIPETAERDRGPRSGRMMLDDWSVEAEVVGEDIYKITVEETRAGPAGAQSALRLDGSEGSVLVVDPLTKTIRLQDGNEEVLGVYWAGSIRKIESFGRAGVPGMEIRWGAHPDEVIYGLGERFNGANQNGQRVEMWIVDAPGQGDQNDLSYYVTPVLYSSRGYAFFAEDNPEAVFDLNAVGRGLHSYERAGRSISFYLAAGSSMKELIQKRIQIQGELKPIPDWAWGPWISRNSYETQSEAEEAIQGMLDRNIPVAAIVQEAWKGSSESGDFNNFSKDRWPEIDKYLAWCRELDIKNVLWQVPILHPSSPHYAVGKEKGYFVKKPDGTISHRMHWLAGFANLDFTNPDAVKFWQDLLRPVVRMGAYGFKADDGEDIKPDDVFFDGRRGWQMHNEYSTLYNKALTELFEQEGVDGLLWARSGSLGIEQCPALWAGDQYATWSQMRSLLPAGLSTSMSGMPFWGHDIGGYMDNPSPELYMRWVQFGAFSPLMQYHGIARREPWEFGQLAVKVYATLARIRMNLRPTLIELGREAAKTGIPIMRPMHLEFPDDERFDHEETQYMLGSDLLVAPVLEEGATGRRVKLPEGNWQHLLYPVSFKGPADISIPIGLESVPVFVREGADLKVELAEGESLGTWSNGLPVRALSFDAERALLKDFRAPATGSVLTRNASVSFQADDETAGSLQAVWKHEGGQRSPGLVQPVKVGDRYVIDLSQDLPADILNRKQVFVIRQQKADGRTETLFEGALRWEAPLVLSAEPQGSHYVQSGVREIRTRLVNRSDEPLTVRVLAGAASGATLSSKEQEVEVASQGEVVLDWAVDFSPLDEVTDTTIQFVAMSGNTRLGEARAVYTRPVRWVVCGPFPMPPKTGHSTPLPPEWITDPDANFQTRNGTVRWSALDDEHTIRNDGIDFHDAFGPQEHAVAYAMTKLKSDRARDVELRFGSDDTLTVWLNGENIHSVETYRLVDVDQEIIPVRLKPGVNTIVAKVAQDVNPWRMHFRVTGPQGSPVDGLTDGFTDHKDYVPDRPKTEKIADAPKFVSWSLAGPFPFDREKGWPPGAHDAMALHAQWPPKVDGVQWLSGDPASGYSGLVDLNGIFGLQQNVDAYAAAEVEVKRPTPVVISCGSDDGIVIWLNGTKIHEAQQWRGYKPGEDEINVTLPPGRNRLLCMIRQGGGDWKFRIDLWDVSKLPARPLDLGR